MTVKSHFTVRLCSAHLVEFECVLQALHSALHTFDMIESVLVRIEELTEVKENL